MTKVSKYIIGILALICLVSLTKIYIDRESSNTANSDCNERYTNLRDSINNIVIDETSAVDSFRTIIIKEDSIIVKTKIKYEKYKGLIPSFSNDSLDTIIFMGPRQYKMLR